MSDSNKLLLELYKELGLEARQYNMEVYATNRLMLPPLVIGLLVLYGEVEEFLGVKFQNDEVVHWLVCFGCIGISLIWILNVSRLAQLSRWHRETMIQCERQLGLLGHRKISAKDEESKISKIVRHNTLRFIGFAGYFSLLVRFMLQRIDSNELIIWILSFLGGLIVSYLIWVFSREEG